MESPNGGDYFQPRPPISNKHSPLADKLTSKESSSTTPPVSYGNGAPANDSTTKPLSSGWNRALGALASSSNTSANQNGEPTQPHQRQVPMEQVPSSAKSHLSSSSPASSSARNWHQNHQNSSSNYSNSANTAAPSKRRPKKPPRTYTTTSTTDDVTVDPDVQDFAKAETPMRGPFTDEPLSLHSSPQSKLSQERRRFKDKSPMFRSSSNPFYSSSRKGTDTSNEGEVSSSTAEVPHTSTSAAGHAPASTPALPGPVPPGPSSTSGLEASPKISSQDDSSGPNSPHEGVLQFIVDAFLANKQGSTSSRPPTIREDSHHHHHQHQHSPSLDASSTSRQRSRVPTSSHNQRRDDIDAQGQEQEQEQDQEQAQSEAHEIRRASESDAPSKLPTSAQNRWAALRTRLKSRPQQTKRRLNKSLSGTDLVSELSTGHLAILMLKMHFDRDEHDDRRIPILLNYLKLRVTDSLYPLHNTHALFRIELEYGDGLVKWVIYRELRDFVNLHAHYRVANFTGAIEDLPTFPKTSLPYFNVLRRESKSRGTKEIGKREFAQLQREAIENYLLKLMRVTMFRPEANRLCKFLEFSALTAHFAASGGQQGKQGYLRVASNASRRNPAKVDPNAIRKRRQPKWFAVRESFLAAVHEPGQVKIWDVFLFDSDFCIEQPPRFYKQGVRMITSGYEQTMHHRHASSDNKESQENNNNNALTGVADPNDPSTTDGSKPVDTASHTFYVCNSERKVKLVAKSERQMDQFIASIEKLATSSIWTGHNRFDSFAPIRMKVQAQWLIDGRDYFWNLSRAIAMAKKTIYIHDWWISPELYLRRPPSQNARWRLDRLFKRKADQGVKIFIIIYKEVSNVFAPVDSTYTKSRLLELSPNIHVQRSPSHAQTGTYYWSHHEKLCVIDDTIAFMGGLDQCFGRWDTTSHVVTDDSPIGFENIEQMHASKGKASASAESDGDVGQIWPGKDYSNSRVSDFFQLTKPEADMYDRRKVPRQPWHDIGLQLIGQPARDLSRHFIQRWNYLLRTKNHSRFMPFLMPPSDFSKPRLETNGLLGTCEAQICRSAGPWSIGTPKKVEHSIQNAYIKAIQMSERFVYIENQYFCSSTLVENTEISNKIGDALVDRIIRAYNEETPWRAIILIPLLPGYPMTMDQADASSVRLIMESQFRSICRGEKSVFGRLRAEGIEPENYIQFFSLRSWGQMSTGNLVTQDVYIHAKAMIVDDRTVIIGSANINDRSQRGDRDSELACIIRDTDMIDSTMAGKPFKVGRFAHSMRVRLMREHLGIDVDSLEEEEMQTMAQNAAESALSAAHAQKENTPPSSSSNLHIPAAQEDDGHDQGLDDRQPGPSTQQLSSSEPNGVKNDGEINVEAADEMQDEQKKEKLKAPETMTNGTHSSSSSSSVSPSTVATDNELQTTADANQKKPKLHLTTPTNAQVSSSNASTADIPDKATSPNPSLLSPINTVVSRFSKRLGSVSKQNPYAIHMPKPDIKVDGFVDPMSDSFYNDVWLAAAKRNTFIFRKVFRCTPDDNVKTWNQFREAENFYQRHEKPLRTSDDNNNVQMPDSATEEKAGTRPRSKSQAEPNSPSSTQDAKKKSAEFGFTIEERDQMLASLEEITGNLVMFPTKFLEVPSTQGSFLWQRDLLQPMIIFT